MQNYTDSHYTPINEWWSDNRNNYYQPVVALLKI